MKYLIGISLVCACVLLPAFAFAQSFTPPVKISASTPAHSPTIVSARNGDIYVSWFANAEDIYFSRSADQGSTFSDPLHVSRQVSSNIYGSLLQRTPRMVVDTKGIIHMIWMEARLNDQSDIWYTRSTDRGASWSSAVSIMDPDDSAKYPQDFCQVACDSSDNLYVAYLDFRGVVRGTEEVSQLHLTKSTDGGASWLAPVVANKFAGGIGGTCECCKLDIAVTATGTVSIVFRSNIHDKRDIWLARSRDGGKSFDSSIRIQTGTWTIGGCPTTGPSLALDAQGNLFCGWRDNRDDSARPSCYFTYLRNDQTQVYPNLDLTGRSIALPNWPSVTVSPFDGKVAYVYQYGSSTRNRLRYSSDGGNSWSANRDFPRATTQTQSLPTLLYAANGRIFTAWQEGENIGSIFVSEITGLTVSSNTAAPKPKITPNPAPPSTPIRLSWARSTAGPFVTYYYSVVSATGTTVLTASTRDTSVTIDSLATGDYKLLVRAVLPNTTVQDSTSFVVAAMGVTTRVENSPVRLLQDASVLRFELNAAQNHRVDIYDASGRVVMSRIGTTSISLYRSELPHGMYWYSVNGERSATTGCFVN